MVRQGEEGKTKSSMGALEILHHRRIIQLHYVSVHLKSHVAVHVESGTPSCQQHDVHAEAIMTLRFMLEQDMMAINMVDGEGFRELLNYIELGYRVPSRGTITTANY